jgi:hypothetical protein
MTVADLTDYVLQLRSRMRSASPGSEDHEHGHYFDLVAYWKEQCQKLQEKCNDLRSENIKLERSNHQLITRTSCIPDIDPTNTINTSKRKTPVASPTRNSKRPKGVQQVEQSAAETQEGIDDDFDFLDGLGQGESLSYLRSLTVLISSNRRYQSH